MITRQLYLCTMRKACHLRPVALHEFTLQSIMVLSGLRLWHLQVSHSAAGHWCHLRDLVIAAKAGIHSANPWECAVVGLDSRFRGNDQRLEWIPIPNDTSTGRRGFLTLLLGEYKFLGYARGGKAAGDSRGRVVATLLLCAARPLRTTTLVARPDASGSHSGGHPHPEHHVAQRHSGFAQSSQIRPAKLAGITARLPFRSGGVCATLGLLQAESSNHPGFC